MALLVSVAQAGPQQAALWQEAEAAKNRGDFSVSSRLFQQYYEQFRETARAEEALWQAAQGAKQQALASPAPDWERVRNLFRLHTAGFPKTARADEAYFELGLSHYRMRFYREALSYFKLFAVRYPGSPLLAQARFWQGQTFFTVGQFAQAADAFREVAQGSSGDQDLKVKALMGLGDTLSATGDLSGALSSFAALMQKYPDYYLRDPELLRKLGFVQLQLGREKEGRDSLYHYLNLAGNLPESNELLFALAESSLREGDRATALRLNRRILEQGKTEERAVRLARFRLAEAADDPEKKLSRWQKKSDLADPAGDGPFRAVLDHHHAEPIAQDARRVLFRRYQARNDFENALEMGRSYLRNDEPGPDKDTKENFSQSVLLFLGEQLLARKEYEKLYQLYVNEHRHVAALGNGRFLYQVGQALEAMALFEQASVVYYRTMALTLSATEKADLYFRRVELFLRLKDFAAADKVLSHLRKIYKNTKEIGEVYYLSGRLSEARGNRGEALEYYRKAILLIASPARRPVYAEAQLSILFAGGPDGETLSLLNSYRQEKWLGPEVLQGWYGRLAEALADREPELAMEACLAGTGKDMPQTGLAAQRVYLQLGELYVNASQVDKGREVLQKARQGPDALLGKRAMERLNRLDIERERRR